MFEKFATHRQQKFTAKKSVYAKTVHPEICPFLVLIQYCRLNVMELILQCIVQPSPLLHLSSAFWQSEMHFCHAVIVAEQSNALSDLLYSVINISPSGL